MNFVDSTLIKLADPQMRSTFFNEEALQQVAATAYDVSGLSLQNPFSAVFDELTIGVALPRYGLVEGAWTPVGGMERTELRMQVAGLSNRPAERVEALWRGAVVARASLAADKIIQVGTGMPSLGAINKKIVADLGALPGDPAALEQERRARLIAFLQAGLDQPAVFDESSLDAWLAQQGVSTIGELMERLSGITQPATVSVTYSPPNGLPATPRRLPVSALILIRPADVSISGLLLESKGILEQAATMNIETRPDPALPLRRAVILLWAIPKEVFDDTGWPGANANERRTRAGAWLAQQGIALAAL